ncbi:hypothetical protein LguiA_023208 [Lonicera macranthoides]
MNFVVTLEPPYNHFESNKKVDSRANFKFHKFQGSLKKSYIFFLDPLPPSLFLEKKNLKEKEKKKFYYYYFHFLFLL